MKIKCITIDDEPLALDQMQEFIAKVEFLELVGSFKNGMSALNFMKTNAVDLLFLDIQMDDLTGIQLLEAIPVKPKVILTTAYDEYALKGYELDVSDYLLKPISFDRFVKAVNKVYDQLLQNMQKTQNTKSSNEATLSKEFIFVKVEHRLQKINLANILYVQAMKDYLKIFLSGKKVITHMTMKNMEAMLSKNNFIRVHKSFIVNINNIDSICKQNIYIDNQVIPIGAYYKKDFFRILEQVEK